MSSLDILYLVLAISTIVTAVLINMILYNVWRTLRTFRITSEKALNITNNILNVRNKVKLAILKPIHKVLSMFK